MKEFSISLFLERDIEKSIVKFSNGFKFNRAVGTLDDKSKPHCTIVKWKANEIANEQLKKLNKLMHPVKIILSGITALPSRYNEKDKGIWVEISILKTEEIKNMAEKIVDIVGKENALNDIGQLFRPHITIAKSYDKTILIKGITPKVLRKTILATPKLHVMKNVEFYK